MGRHSCCQKQKLRKGLWSPEEDEKLVRYITKHGHSCWSTVPEQAGLQRCGKSCRLRWINYLRPELKRGNFTAHEESIILELHATLGNRWSQIAGRLPGRTDNEIKNFWNSCLKKKLKQMGVDPNTHKRISEVSSNIVASTEESSTDKEDQRETDISEFHDVHKHLKQPPKLFACDDDDVVFPVKVSPSSERRFLNLRQPSVQYSSNVNNSFVRSRPPQIFFDENQSPATTTAKTFPCSKSHVVQDKFYPAHEQQQMHNYEENSRDAPFHVGPFVWCLHQQEDVIAEHHRDHGLATTGTLEKQDSTTIYSTTMTTDVKVDFGLSMNATYGLDSEASHRSDNNVNSIIAPGLMMFPQYESTCNNRQFWDSTAKSCSSKDMNSLNLWGFSNSATGSLSNQDSPVDEIQESATENMKWCDLLPVSAKSSMQDELLDQPSVDAMAWYERQASPLSDFQRIAAVLDI